MHHATPHQEGSRPVIRFGRVLSRPPDEVWRALTDGLRQAPDRQPLFDGRVAAFEPVLGPPQAPPAGAGRDR
ncbi:hypothetical protein [Streptomyces sp. NPDC059788]|uniref:hypothetical protein n=1 Tax=Streptomyces sp. NPDC059788 TaxID=3346948 RepID=UPI00365E626C